MIPTSFSAQSRKTLVHLSHEAGQDAAALEHVQLTGAGPVYPSSFHVGLAAQCMVAAAALSACEVGHYRGQPRQSLKVDATHAAMECSGWYSVNGVYSDPWNPFTGLYRCSDNWVRIHANLIHHREGFLRLLGLDPQSATREAAERRAMEWRGVDLGTALAEKGLVGTALRSFAE